MPGPVRMESFQPHMHMRGKAMMTEAMYQDGRREELTFVALGGEVVVVYALRLKRELGQATWVAGYSHDVMAYIPSLRVWNEGGYEGGGAMLYYGLPSRWDSTVEQRVITEALRQAEKLRQSKKQK